MRTEAQGVPDTRVLREQLQGYERKLSRILQSPIRAVSSIGVPRCRIFEEHLVTTILQ